MPVRTNRTRPTNPPQEKKASDYNDLLDLSFLPREIVERVDDIFDSYFGLGMKPRTSRIESNLPDFPTEISSLSSPDVGDYLAEYTAWYAFAADKNKYVTTACNYLESEMQRIVDLEVGKQVLDKGNIEAKKAKARSSEEYMMYYSYLQKMTGLKTMLSQEIAMYDKCITSLSREVSRREHNAGF